MEKVIISQACVRGLTCSLLRSGRLIDINLAVLCQPTGQSLFWYVQPHVSPRGVVNDCSTVRTQSTLNPWMPSRCISGARLVPRVVTRHVSS